MKQYAKIMIIMGILSFIISAIIMYTQPSKNFSFKLSVIAVHFSIPTLLTGLICLRKCEWIKRHCRVKSTVLSLIMSALIGLCMCCATNFILLSVAQSMVVHYTIAIPVNGIVTIGACLVLIMMFFVYIVDKDKHIDRKSGVFDLFCVIIYALPFAWLFGQIIEWFTPILKQQLNI